MTPKESILILLMKIRRNLTLRKDWVYDAKIGGFSFLTVSAEELELIDQMIEDIKKGIELEKEVES
jgi:hypothetical protein